MTFLAASIIGIMAFGFVLKIFEEIRYAAMNPEQKAAFDAKEAEQAKRDAEAKTQSDRQLKDSALLQMSKDAVKARLKDPGSAIFKDVRIHHGKDEIPTACGTVNAKNSFGAFIGDQRFISNGLSVFMEDEVSDFENAWARFCTD